MRWVGGKYKQLSLFKAFFPPSDSYNYYVEPFLGSGAVFLDLEPTRSIISDKNIEIVNVFHAIRKEPRMIIELLEKHDEKDSESYYYEIRDQFNSSEVSVGHPDGHPFVCNIHRAGQFLYLNARCYNGLYRVNKNGKMNAPFARDLKGLKQVCNDDTIIKVSTLLRRPDIVIEHASFENVLNLVPTEWDGPAFFYLDPPYESHENTNCFKSYNKTSWGENDLEKLSLFVDKINDNGDMFMLCNNATDIVMEKFARYIQHEHDVPRSVSRDVNNRVPAKEIVIVNYDTCEGFYQKRVTDFI